MKSHVLCLVLLAAALSAFHGLAAEPAPTRTPRSAFTVQFPKMPPTFYAVFQKKDVKA